MIVLMLATAATVAVSNINLVSESTNIAAWTRQAVMARGDNSIIDPSGVFVKAADAAARSNAIDRVAQISDAAAEGMRKAIGALIAVTNQVQPNAYHFSMMLPPPQAPKSLMGFVVKEETDGIVDTQWVWYSHKLSRRPIRRVVYKTPTGEYSQNVEWDGWTEEGETIEAFGRVWNGCHKCVVARPVSARNLPALTRNNEVFGGDKGFDFGSVILTVDGRVGITTNIYDSITGTTLNIVNGIIKTNEREAE